MKRTVTRLEKLEAAARAMMQGGPVRPCYCPYGKRRFYFDVQGMTKQEMAAAFPENRLYCPKCGGKRNVVIVDRDDMRA